MKQSNFCALFYFCIICWNLEIKKQVVVLEIVYFCKAKIKGLYYPSSRVDNAEKYKNMQKYKKL